MSDPDNVDRARPGEESPNPRAAHTPAPAGDPGAADSPTAPGESGAAEATAAEASGANPARGRDADPEEIAAQDDTERDPATPEANEESMKAAEHDSQDFEQFRTELEAVERKIAGEIDPGVRAMVVAGSVFVLLLSLVLPHAGTARGFDVLLYDAAAQTEHIGLPSRVFEWFVVVFGIGFSLAALITRRWALAWIAVAGSAIASVFGVFSIWHRQTPGLGNYEGAGPGVGLILATIAVMVLTFHWIRVVWSRTAVHLAAEEQRRINAAKAEEADRKKLFGDK